MPHLGRADVLATDRRSRIQGGGERRLAGGRRRKLAQEETLAYDPHGRRSPRRIES